MIPLNDLDRDHAHIQNEIENAVIDVLRSGRYINGPQVSLFEDQFASFLFEEEKSPTTHHTIGVSSGTDALLVALMALGIGPGDEVIVPSFSFGAPAEVVRRLGASLRFADVSATTFNLDPTSVEEVASEKTKAIIAVHLFGQCAPMTPLRTLCDQHNWFLIEDAAQAIGATQNGTPAGFIGDVGCFSFYPTKNIGACGDAGAITTTNNDVAQKARLIRNHGYEKKYEHKIIGGNFRLDEIQAAILNVKMPHMKEYNGRRGEIAAFFDKNLEGLITPFCAPENTHVYHRYLIQSEERSQLIDKLNDNKISNETYYPSPLHTQECFGAPASLPKSALLCERALALPLFPSMNDSELEKIVNIVNK